MSQATGQAITIGILAGFMFGTIGSVGFGMLWPEHRRWACFCAAVSMLVAMSGASLITHLLRCAP